MLAKAIRATSVLKNNKIISQKDFLELYSSKFVLSKDKVSKQLKILKESFTCLFTANGPIIVTTLWNKKPEFSWGQFALLINIYDIYGSKGIGINGNSRIDIKYGNFAIHPNIHTDINGYDKSFYKICLGSVREVSQRCINYGEIVLACEEIFYRWCDIFFSRCESCGDNLKFKQRLCNRCSNKLR